MTWRKINRILHRDFGYFFVATSIVYAVSGIALNHIRDWNPNYVITTRNIKISEIPGRDAINELWVLGILDEWGEKDNYKKHYFPAPARLKIFLKGGSLLIDLNSGSGFIEKIRKRPIFHGMNYLHYNPGKVWTWFSDIYAGSLILLSVTGLFILRGKNGITGRGAWLTLAGIVVPLIILYLIL